MNRTVEGNLLKVQGACKTLEICTSIEKNTAVMKLSGSVNSDTKIDLEDEILAFISMGKHVLIDFEQLEYIASTAQSMLMKIQSEYADRIGVNLEICHVPKKLYEQFRSSRMDTQLRIRREE
ncbi:MAG: STAS domain-containing protein [Clostridia bacterium]|nr:STAS domain-containing protein [Clostridia bacterium]